MTREHYHALLDAAMTETKEGDFFLPVFCDKVMRELRITKVDDGFGQSVDLKCPSCGEEAMQVVRPGVFRCAHCD